MVLLVTGKIQTSIGNLMPLFEERHVPAFRFNLDMFDSYQFMWRNNEFSITDPTGRFCRSENISAMVFYHARMPIDYTLDHAEIYGAETAWVISWLNHLHDCLYAYGIEHKRIRLWNPDYCHLSKTFQMKLAKKYFAVPDFHLHWGYSLPSREVVIKTLTQRPFSTNGLAYVKIADQAILDPRYPWFTQEVADGDRDATILYINGKVHCFQFATVRGELTDWRITQGTEANQWKVWNAGKEFENKVRAYMHDMNLKYGRLDFIIGGKEPQFLEVNPEGQFGWLDDEDGFPLHNEVADAILDPATTITL